MPDDPLDSGPGLSADFGRFLLALGGITVSGLLLGPGDWAEIGSVDPLGLIDAWWAGLWGLGAWPVALALLAAGLALIGRRGEDLMTLPWRSVIAFELAILAGLALAQTMETPQGGLVGQALAASITLTLGPGLVRPTFACLFLLALWLGTGAILPAAWASSLETLLREAAPPAGPEAPPASSPRGLRPARDLTPPSAGRPGPQTPAPPPPAPPPAVPPTATRARAGRRAALRDLRALAQPGAGRQGAAEALRRGPEAVPAQAARPLPTIRRAGHEGPRQPRSGAADRGKAGRLPPLSLLAESKAADQVDSQALHAQAARIEQCLAGFGIPVEVVEIEPGPNVTRFALRPGLVQRAGQPMRVRLSRITAHRHDLCLALSADGLRIEAPIPGRSLVGIEVPSRRTEVVAIRALLEDPTFQALRKAGGLPLAIGRRTGGLAVVARLTTMPHLLIAGATGSGKSVFMNSLLVSLVGQQTPDEVRLILIDPKRVELGRYASLPHLVAAPVTDPAEAVAALRWAVAEMEERYRRLEARGVRDRAAFNRLSTSGEALLPALVLIIDELADLMMTSSQEVEPLLTRLAQMGRATGVHLIVATQRPSVDVLTGLIKANFPSRVAFAVASAIDSRVILDQTGAETLSGSGDLLYQPPDQAHPIRAQGAWVGDDELERLLGFWEQGPWQAPYGPAPWADLVDSDPDAALYVAAQEIALANPHHSASLLQRRLRIGYAKAKALHDRLLADGFD